jgi:hypothetical protein
MRSGFGRVVSVGDRDCEAHERKHHCVQRVVPDKRDLLRLDSGGCDHLIKCRDLFVAALQDKLDAQLLETQIDIGELRPDITPDLKPAA